MSADWAGDKNCNPLLIRLRQAGLASEADLDALGCLFTKIRKVDSRTKLLSERQSGELLHVLLDGWAYGYRLLTDGKCQITTLLLPGDVCDLDRLHLGHLNYTLGTLTPCTIAVIDCLALRALALSRPGVARSLGWLGALENAALTERVVSFGRRSAHQRVAHLLCELFIRLTATGRARKNGYELPMIQPDLSDLLGLSTVHVNRVLQRLRGDGLITLSAGNLIILDWPKLCEVAEFQSDYLNLARLNSSDDAYGSTSRTGAAGAMLRGLRAAA